MGKQIRGLLLKKPKQMEQLNWQVDFEFLSVLKLIIIVGPLHKLEMYDILLAFLCNCFTLVSLKLKLLILSKVCLAHIVHI